jgi:hypothetical protein
MVALTRTGPHSQRTTWSGEKSMVTPPRDAGPAPSSAQQPPSAPPGSPDSPTTRSATSHRRAARARGDHGSTHHEADEGEQSGVAAPGSRMHRPPQPGEEHRAEPQAECAGRKEREQVSHRRPPLPAALPLIVDRPLLAGQPVPGVRAADQQAPDEQHQGPRQPARPALVHPQPSPTPRRVGTATDQPMRPYMPRPNQLRRPPQPGTQLALLADVHRTREPLVGRRSFPALTHRALLELEEAGGRTPPPACAPRTAVRSRSSRAPKRSCTVARSAPRSPPGWPAGSPRAPVRRTSRAPRRRRRRSAPLPRGHVGQQARHQRRDHVDVARQEAERSVAPSAVSLRAPR